MARGGKPSSTRPSSAGAKKKRQGGHEEWMDDEVDAHHRGRDKISLDPDDDDEDSEDDFDDAADAVMDLDDDSDDEEDSDDSDDDDDDEDEEEKDDEDAAADDGDAYDSQEDEEDAALIRAMKAQQKKLNASGITRAKKDDDESESESESESDGPGIRGKKKSDFYGDDREVDHEGLEDEEDREEEEKEARRMQRSLAEGMDAADYGLSESESESESASEEKTLGAKAKKLASSGKKTKTGEAAAKDDKKRAKRAKKKPKSDGKDADAAAAVIEALGEDDAHGAGAAATDAVTADAPEIMALQRELAKNLEEVKNVVEPALQVAKKGGYATELGISYLETKHMLMLSYCVNIVMYLLLKSEGVAVKDHPVVVRLVEIRTYLEKLRPIDRKLKYQIEKLLKLASEQNEREELGDGDGGGGGDAGEDPLAFRPNPDALVSKVEEDAADGDGDGGVYRPPKMLPTSMEDFEEGGKSNKEKRKEKEARRRASRSALIKELAQELGEAPEELGGGEGDMSSAFAKREFARMEARAKIEEDLFTRVPLSKTERRRQKATTRSVNSLSQVGDFGDDVADLVEVAEQADGRKRQRLVDAVSMGAPAIQKRPKPVGGDALEPTRDTLGDRRSKYEKGVNRKIAEREAAKNEGMYEDDTPKQHVEDDDAYVDAAATRDAKRRAKEDKYRRRAGIIAVPEREMEDDDAKRDVGKKIMANRGLTPHRNKDHKNPRKRLRDKFAKAVVRRKGQVRSMRDDGGAYGGEQTGIKTSVTKSRKFGK